MNVSTIWSFVLASSSLQMSEFQSLYRKADLNLALKELEPGFGLPLIESYDYIVVGGGSAGCVIAGKLSEEGFSVLLVEKGGDPVPAIMSPFHTSVRFHPAVNDFYYTLPQTNAGTASNGVLTVLVGTMLGGSGSHNAMTYLRGSPELYDGWADQLDDPSFSYTSMLQTYKEMENMTGFLFKEEEREDFYGQHGPLSIETSLPAAFGDWFEAGRLLGYKAADPNAHMEPFQTTTKDGVRETSYTAFIKRRPNSRLKILRFSVGLKVLIKNQAAYGLSFLRHGIAQVALTRKEVILTAGALVSPLILVRSGIGPCALLDEAGIPCLVDLPGVGSRIEDHVAVKIPKFTIKSPNFPVVDDQGMMSFLFNFPGGKRATGALGLMAFIRSSVNPEKGSWPDLRFKFVQDPLLVSETFVQIGVTRLESYGSLWFNASAIKEGERDSTKIVRPNPAYLSSQADRDAMTQGLDFLFNGILATPQFNRMGFTFVENIAEGCEDFVPNSKRFWICFAQRRTVAAAYLTGACRMGPEKDPMRVVDNQFRVVGVDALRVADSSAMPSISNADTHAPTLALAYKAVKDMIKI